MESALGVSLGVSVTDMAVVIETTSIELIIGFLVVLWRRSSDKTSWVVKQLAVPLKEEKDEFEVASGKTRVTIFSRTQTSTAKGFAKDWWIWYGSQKQSKGSYPTRNSIVLTEGKQKEVLKAAGALFSHICEV